MRNRLRHIVYLLCLCSIGASGLAGAEPTRAQVSVRVATNLQADARLAAEKRVPLLLMFSMRGCEYCRIVEEDFLRPMLISGDYDDKVIIRKVMTDSFDEIHDFDGQRVDVDTLTYRYSASFTPTVVFVDASGKRVAQNIVGLTTVDFYGGDLDDQLDVALERIRTTRVAQRTGVNPVSLPR